MYQFTPPNRPIPDKMIHLAQGLDAQYGDSCFKDITLPFLPPRDIDVLLQLIQLESTLDLSILEWISLLDNKQAWDNSNPNQSYETNKLIWECANRNAGLRHILLWRLALYLDGKSVDIPKGLAKQFSTAKYNIKISKPKMNAIESLISNQYGLFCDEMLRLLITPQKLMQKLGLPRDIDKLELALKQLPIRWIRFSKVVIDESRFIRIVDQLEVEKQDIVYSSLLENSKTSQLTEHTSLLNNLRALYSPLATKSRYSKLSNKARDTLHDLLGVLSFNEFKDLIENLTTGDTARTLNLSDQEINQLNKRVSFWSNYQSRFLSFRVFLPNNTYNLLLQKNKISDSYIMTKMQGVADSEVCILEFEGYFIVEFLRGRGRKSSLRVLKKNASHQELLKSEKNTVTQDELEALQSLEQHDHLYCWQNSCEKMLRTKYKIYPNSSLKRFLISSATQTSNAVRFPYSRATGLPPLSRKNADERKLSLAGKRSTASC